MSGKKYELNGFEYSLRKRFLLKTATVKNHLSRNNNYYTQIISESQITKKPSFYEYFSLLSEWFTSTSIHLSISEQKRLTLYLIKIRFF